jgi:general secretion pathway protein A
MRRDANGDTEDMPTSFAAGPLLPSRRVALEACHAGLATGLVLITGEPGIGKTWLAGRLAASVAEPQRWVAVDVGPGDGPAELLRAIGHSLGLDTGGDLRLRIGDDLAERSRDCRRIGLIVDETHLASSAVLEEIRLLSNRAGRPEGFAALVLVGQTALLRRLSTKVLRPLEARIAARVHLRPIDADEGATLLEAAGVRGEVATLDRLHRDASGNPRRLQVLSTRAPLAAANPPTLAPPTVGFTGPSLVPAKPPLRAEEGMIEVGWEPEHETSQAVPERVSAKASVGTEPAEEVVDDHYAALQAWNEWSQNQGRRPAITATATESGTFADVGDLAVPSALTTLPQVWADQEQGFAPYSELFSRARQGNDSER